MLVDSHCHLDMFAPDDRGEIVTRAAEAGVGEMVSIGTRFGQSRQLIEMASGWDRVWCTVGVHPNHVAEEPPVADATLAGLARHPKVVGIGESGLDYFYNRKEAVRQQDSFRQHIRAARMAGLPLVIHARDADADIAAILQEEWDAGGPYAFLLHCFSSGRALAEHGVRLGGYVSFSGILTFPKSTELREIARDLPEDRLLVETDSPYLAPVPFRGKRNEPAYVAHTARVLAEVRGMTPEALAALTTANFRRLFARTA